MAGGDFSKYRWVILGVCWLVYVIVFLQRLSIGPLAPFLKDDLGLTSAQVGSLMSASALGYMLTLVPAGWLVDRIGVRRMLLLGSVTGGILISGMFFITTFAQGLTIMGLAGIGCGCLMPATTKAVLAWFPVKERATAMGLKQTAVNIGGIIAAITLPTLALALSWRYGFVSISVLAICIGIVSFILYREAPQKAEANIDERITQSRARPSVRDILKGREIWLVAFSGTCMLAVEFSILAHLVLYLQTELLFAVVIAGFFLAMLEAGGGLGKPVSGLVSDRLWHGGRRMPYILMCCVTGAICLILSFLQQGSPMWAIVPLLLLLGFAGIGWGGLHLTLAGEIAGKELAGTVTGTVVLISMIGTVIGPPIFGHIVDITGSYQISWQMLVFASAVAATLIFFVREGKRRI
ncbi:MFS transporter [Chloroflexota bacterium]